MENEKITGTSIKIGTGLYERIASLSKMDGRHIKWHIDRAVSEYLQKKGDTMGEEKEKMPDDYCPVGLSRCPSCGAQYEYPVSGCSVCHKSFCD